MLCATILVTVVINIFNFKFVITLLVNIFLTWRSYLSFSVLRELHRMAYIVNILPGFQPHICDKAKV